MRNGRDSAVVSIIAVGQLDQGQDSRQLAASITFSTPLTIAIFCRRPARPQTGVRGLQSVPPNIHGSVAHRKKCPLSTRQRSLPIFFLPKEQNRADGTSVQQVLSVRNKDQNGLKRIIQ
eukprot:753953-Hanusia_phi.AAC.7